MGDNSAIVRSPNSGLSAPAVTSEQLSGALATSAPPLSTSQSHSGEQEALPRASSGSRSKKKEDRKLANWQSHWNEIEMNTGSKAWKCKNCSAILDTDHATKQAQHNMRCFAMSTMSVRLLASNVVPESETEFNHAQAFMMRPSQNRK
ncbi:hypothetical protein FGB62_105g03 [Gracilaria domingensis]|nr:hypothetical protein FGB62_105g03 [Gracilaria domingensis]